MRHPQPYPPLPPGAKLDAAPATAALPPLPAGATLDAAPQQPEWGSPAARAEAQKGIERIGADEPYAEAEGRHGRGSVAKGQAQAQDEKAAQAPPPSPTGPSPDDTSRPLQTAEGVNIPGTEGAPSPWAGKPRTQETAERTLARYDAKLELEHEDPNRSPARQDKLEHDAGYDAGGGKDIIASAVYAVSKGIGAIPDLMRTAATADNSAMLGKYDPRGPLTRLTSQALYAIADDIDPKMHAAAEEGAHAAELHMTPEFKDAISQKISEGYKNPLYWENMGVNFALFALSDGRVGAAVARPTFSRVFNEVMTKFEGKGPRSVIEAIASDEATKAAVKSTALASVAFNGGVIGGQNGEDVYNQIKDQPDETKMKWATYAEARRNGVPEPVATEDLARDQSAIATGIAGLGAAGPGAAFSKFFSYIGTGIKTEVPSMSMALTKSLAAAGGAGVGQTTLGGAASRLPSTPTWKDFEASERKNFLGDVMEGIAFTPLGLAGLTHYTEGAVDKLNNVSAETRIANVSKARDNLLGAALNVERLEAATHDPDVPVSYNDLERAHNERDAAFKHYIKVSENAGLIGEEEHGKGSQPATGDQRLVGRVQRPETGERGARREAQREAAAGQQPETKLEAQVPAPSGGETGRGDGQPGQLRQRATGVESEDGQRPGRGDQGPEHLTWEGNNGKSYTATLNPDGTYTLESKWTPKEEAVVHTDAGKIGAVIAPRGATQTIDAEALQRIRERTGAPTEPEGPEHLGATGPLEPEKPPEQIFGGKPHIKIKPKLPGELGATGPLEAEPLVERMYAGKPKITLKPAKEGGFEPPKVTTPEASKNIAAIPPPNYPLGGAETAVSNRMKRIVANVDSAEVAYAKLPDTDGGNIINTDSIREMSPDYASSVKARSRFSNAVQEPSSWLADQLYTRRLAKPVREGKDAKVFFTAGGPDSGKSVSLGSTEAQSADMIYDGNMNNLTKARRRIKMALDSGRSVDIQFHDRDPIKSFKSMLMRAMKLGRSVPVEAHAAANNDSFKTVQALSRQYGNDKRVRFHAIDVDTFKESTLDALAEKHYEVTPSQLHQIAAEEYRNGRITEAVFRGVSGKRAERLVGRGEDHGRLPGVEVAARGAEQHPSVKTGAGAEGHVPGEEGHRVGAQEEDRLGEGVPGEVQVKPRYRVSEPEEKRPSDIERNREDFNKWINKSREDWERDQSQAITDEAARVAGKDIRYRTDDLDLSKIVQGSPEHVAELRRREAQRASVVSQRIGEIQRMLSGRSETGYNIGGKSKKQLTPEQRTERLNLRNELNDLRGEGGWTKNRPSSYRIGEAPDYHDAAFLSAERYDMTPEQNARRTVNLAAALRRAGLVPKDAEGRYTEKDVTSSEASFMVHPETWAQHNAIIELAKRFKQDSVLYTRHGEAALRYTKDGRIEKKGYIREAGRREAEARTAYTRLADGRHLVTDEKPVVEDHTEADAKRRAKGFMTSVGDLPDTTPEEKAVIASGGMDHGELKEVVEHITKRFGVRVNIVEHPRDMPDRISRWDAENLPIGGVFIPDVDGGTVHLFRANLGSADHAAITAYHEIVGHMGLRGILKQHGVDHYAEVMDGIASSFPELIPKVAKRNDIDLASGGAIARREAAEELFAYASERRVLSTEQKGRLSKIIDYVRDALRRIGLIRDADGQRLNELYKQGREGIWTESDITSLIDRSSKAMIRGAGKRLLERDLLSQRITGQPRQYNVGERETPRWHSALVEAVEGSKQSKAPAEQWKGMLKGLAGVKKEEMEWMGVHDWLDQQQGAVSKADLVNYLREHQVKLSETTLAGRTRTLNKKSKYFIPEVERVIREAGGINTTEHLETNLGNDSAAYREIREKFPELWDGGGGASWAYKVLEDLGRVENPLATQYHRPTLNIPGGENYQEKLLTLPSEKNGFQVTDSNGHKLPRLYDNFGEARNDAEMLGGTVAMARPISTTEDYRSVHWGGHENVLAHVRYDERTDADGKRNLFLQEVQSDWHQAGRKHGYQGEELTEDERVRGRVPDAPFKTTWHELALKRMIQHAAENGFDRISWTTGDQQAARYDLSKVLNRLRLRENPEGDFTLQGHRVDDGSRRIPGTDVLKVYKNQAELERKLPDFIGKEAAQKLLNAEPKPMTLAGQTREEYHASVAEGKSSKNAMLWNTRELRDQELSIGGEGMKGFYDKMLPAAAEKLTKKFGGKVGTAEMPTERVIGKGMSPVSVHSMDITPEMKKAATAGGPLTAMFRTSGQKSKDVMETVEKVGKKDSPARREVRDSLARIEKYLTPEEREKLNRATAKNVLDLFDQLPTGEEMAHVAYAGKAKRGWYRKSAEAISNIFGPDAPRFSALLASLSPQSSVEVNLSNAIQTWINWDAAGRPQGRAAIIKIMGDSVMGNKLTDSILPAWINNTVDSLTHPEPEKLTISGPKVNSFMRNLHGHVGEVTLDSWMAHYANVDAKLFGGELNAARTDPGKGGLYLAYSARVRQAAEHLSKLTGVDWTPAEVQETIWSWSKAASEYAESFKGLATIADLVKDKDISDALIKGTPDFHTLFLGGEQESVLRAAGYGDQLDSLRGKAEATHAADADKAPAIAVETLEPHLLKAAARLEESRGITKKTTEPSAQQRPMFRVDGEPDDDMESFLSKINPSPRPLAERMASFTRNIKNEAELLGDKLMQWGIDKTWGIQRAWRITDQNGPNLGRMSARLAANHASLMDAIVRYGTPIWNDDAPAISGHTGFQDILAPLGPKVNDFFNAMVARRAGRLMEEGRENLFTREEIAAGNRLWDQNPEFEKAYTELAKFKSAILDFAQDAGVINKETRALWEHDDYLPFFRVMNEQGELGGPGAHAGAIGGDQRVDDAVLFVRLEEHRAGAVAEQHAGGPVGIVDDRRHLVGADDHDLATGASLDELRGRW